MTPNALKTLKEYGEALFIALILAFVIRSFVVQAFKIPSGSMLQTLQIGDHLLVNKFIYGLKLPFTDIIMIPVSDPKFQDIIVFEYPEDPSKDFIKRVIGTPGDTISIKDKVVYRNGKSLNEPYTQHTSSNIIPIRDNMAEITVPTGKYFVMGDNRDNSHDSRFWGFVDRDTIKGKAWIIYWSWTSPFDIRWGNIGKLIH
ncbi:MAG: signal peptidase I [Desulfovibrionaceae bacterium]